MHQEYMVFKLRGVTDEDCGYTGFISSEQERANFHFGCREKEKIQFSYVEISVLVGMLLSSKAVDFVITGCSSGQGMMLACNSMPGVLCGYTPTPKDAYLFAQINDGNAISLPLGEDYTWNGYDNFDDTISTLFSEPFGQGYPKLEATRKQSDTRLMKTIRYNSQVGMTDLLKKMDNELIDKLFAKKDVINYILDNADKGSSVYKWLIEN